MHRRFRLVAVAILISITCPILKAQNGAAPPTTQISRAPLNPALPTLFVVGDSTASTGLRSGWGDPLADYFDPAKINARNRALAGRSSRSFIYEGHWADLLKEMKAGDY